MTTTRIPLSLVACVLAITPAAAQTVRDGSGTIATGGVSQLVFGEHRQRRMLWCQNPLDASEKLVVNIDGAANVAAASFELAAGGSLTLGPLEMAGGVPSGPVTVTAATAGHRFVCKQL